MRGRRVERRFGWDCHGLPAEMEAEKELGLSGAAAVNSIGLEKYNDACRKSVQRYTREWRSYVTRQARWVDFDRDYKTMDLSYMESVLWAFKTLHQKGLVYEGQRVMAYSWALQTPVSNFETRIDDACTRGRHPLHHDKRACTSQEDQKSKHGTCRQGVVLPIRLEPIEKAGHVRSEIRGSLGYGADRNKFSAPKDKRVRALSGEFMSTKRNFEHVLKECSDRAPV